MSVPEEQVRLDEAFERIEETILPCIAMMLESLLDVTRGGGLSSANGLAADLQTLACEVEDLTRAVEKAADATKGVHPLRSAA